MEILNRELTRMNANNRNSAWSVPWYLVFASG